jgi:hypothetical protein
MAQLRIRRTQKLPRPALPAGVVRRVAILLVALIGLGVGLFFFGLRFLETQ